MAKKCNRPTILTLHNYRLICPSATLVHSGKIYERSIHSVFPVEAIWKGVYRHSRLETAAIALMITFHNLIGTWRNKIDFYITLTHFAKEKFRTSALAIPEERLVIKSNFVPDFGVGHLRRQDEFLFVGRLVEEKGIQILLKAAEILRFNLTIIGDGPLKHLVTSAVQESPNIRYLGFQDQDSIAHHMKRCKALIFPSIWYEGFPLTILEAFSTGTLVIASRLGAMAEIIRDGVNGLLFDPGDEIMLARKIVEVDSEPEWAQHLADHARLEYVKNYTPEKNYNLLINIYHKALACKEQAQRKLVPSPAAETKQFVTR